MIVSFCTIHLQETFGYKQIVYVSNPIKLPTSSLQATTVL